MMLRLVRIALAALWAAVLATSFAAAQAPAAPVQLTVAQTGIAAYYYTPPEGSTGAAVVMLNGSDGGYPSRAAAADLAAAGHPVLALAYFRGYGPPIEGLPDNLANIDVAYIGRGVDWLSSHVGTSRPLVVMGLSRGAELALLTATIRPRITGVVAFSPSSVRWSAANDPSGLAPAWVRAGRAFPYAARPARSNADFGRLLANPAIVRRATIPVERIKGHILLVSSRSDNIWPSAYMADRIEARLRRARFRHPVTNLQFDDASHLLMGPGPGVVNFAQGNSRIWFGGSEEGTRTARDAAWAEVKRFLAALRPAQHVD